MIEVLVLIDRDGNPEVVVLVDGKDRDADDSVSVAVVDPGRGWTMSGWNEAFHEELACGHSEEAEALLTAWYVDGASSPYVTRDGDH